MQLINATKFNPFIRSSCLSYNVCNNSISDATGSFRFYLVSNAVAKYFILPTEPVFCHRCNIFLLTYFLCDPHNKFSFSHVAIVFIHTSGKKHALSIAYSLLDVLKIIIDR